jgi:hypothetical protein
MAFWSKKRKRAAARGKRRAPKRGGGAFELFVFVFLCGAVYVIGALSGSAWTGTRGAMLGEYLRATWGGALLVPLLFLVYLCAAWFAGSRIPRPLGQILGTVQIYITTAFTLGLFRQARWSLPWLLAEPGAVGETLARFFLLNGGVLGAVVVAFSSLALSAVLYGFDLPVRLFRALAERAAEMWNAADTPRSPEAPPPPPPGAGPGTPPPARAKTPLPR